MSVTSLEFLLTATDKASPEFKKLSAQVDKAKQHLVNFGKMAAVAAGVAAVAATKLASDFQSSMELVKTQAGASQSEVDKMSQAVLALAGPTATAPAELAKGLYHLESSGLRGAKALEALKSAAEGAKVGGADLESVTNALNAVIASGIPGAKNMDQAMGMLNATVGSGDMRMQDLADAMSTGVLASVKGFGVGLNDVGAALATFGDNNIRGAQAGTELRMAVMAMAAPAKGGAKALKTLGLSASTLSKDMQTGGLNKAVTDLGTHLKNAGYSGNQVGAILTQAFGKKAGVGIQVLEEQLGRFHSKIDEVKKGSTGFGAAWAATQKTFKYQMQQVQVTVETLGVKIGTKLIPIISSMAKSFSKFIDWLAGHKVVFYTIGALIGTFLVVAIGAWIGSLVKAVVEDAIAFAKMTWHVVSWVAKASAQFAIWIVKQAASMAESLVLWGMYATEWIAKQAAMFASVIAKGAIWVAAQAVQLAVSAAKWAWNAAKVVAALAIQNGAILAQKAILVASAAWIGIVTAAQWLWNAAMDANPIGIVIVAVAALVGGLIWFFTQTKLGKEIWKNVTDFFVSAFKNVVSFLGDAWKNILGFFHTAYTVISGVFGKIGGAVKGAFEGALTGVKGMLNGIINLINGAVGGINVLIKGVDNIPGISVPTIPKLPHFATGVQNFSGGLALVGEKGPEVVSLPRGSSVYPNGTGPSSGGINVTVVNKSGATITDLIELYIERNGRTQQISLANGLQRGAF